MFRILSMVLIPTEVSPASLAPKTSSPVVLVVWDEAGDFCAGR